MLLLQQPFAYNTNCTFFCTNSLLTREFTEKPFVSVTELLQLCDVLRDDILPELGVRLEDRDGKDKK